jgi:predicted adenylyl cyclase CyaB
MAKNLELKIAVRNFTLYRNILKKNGAKFIRVLNQSDIYYKTDNGLLKLRLFDDEAELIRYNRDETGKTRWSDYEILKLDALKAESFLLQLFEVETIVKKRRELWMFDNSRIHLDNVKHLGKFLEIETLVINGNADAKKRFSTIKNLLTLDDSKQILSSYRDLMLALK